jgi:hypothetical protein
LRAPVAAGLQDTLHGVFMEARLAQASGRVKHARALLEQACVADQLENFSVFAAECLTSRLRLLAHGGDDAAADVADARRLAEREVGRTLVAAAVRNGRPDASSCWAQEVMTG